MQVHLIDGTYELFRAYFGAPSAKDPGGREVGATRGLMRSLAMLLREPTTTHVAVAFDHEIESFRNELFAGYKTGEGIEPELRAQFELAERGAAALGLVVWPMIEVEADDAIAAGAARYAAREEVSRVLLCSPDKDLYQCVRGQRVVSWDRRRDTILDEEGVKAKIGVPPASVPDYLGLVGDAADGIPGIPKWGARSAAAVLARYGHLEDIPEDAARWEVKVRGAKALAESLGAHREEALLYRRLATLRAEPPPAERLEDLLWEGAERAGLVAFAEEIGDTRLPERVPRFR